MADYNAISDTQLDPDAPLTSQLGYQFRDNPIAIAEGALGAPRNSLGSIERVAAGDVVRALKTSPSANVSIAFQYSIIQSGSLRVRGTNTASPAQGGGLTITRFRGGVGTVILNNTAIDQTVDFAIEPFDYVTINQNASGTGAIATITVSTDGSNFWILNPSDTNYVTGNVF